MIYLLKMVIFHGYVPFKSLRFSVSFAKGAIGRCGALRLLEGGNDLEFHRGRLHRWHLKVRLSQRQREAGRDIAKGDHIYIYMNIIT